MEILIKTDKENIIFDGKVFYDGDIVIIDGDFKEIREKIRNKGGDCELIEDGKEQIKEIQKELDERVNNKKKKGEK